MRGERIMNIQALVVNPGEKGKEIRERLQKLGVQCDAVFCHEEDLEQRLDYADREQYRYLYHGLAEVLANPHRLSYQIVIAGSSQSEGYCDEIVRQLGLTGVVMTSVETVKSYSHYRHIVSFR